MRNKFRLSMFVVAFFMAAMASAQNGTIYRVSPVGAGTQDGSSWDNTMTLQAALAKAQAGAQIWVKGFDEITDRTQLYITPDQSGFVLQSGVQLYGGFKGTENGLNEREVSDKPYKLKYRSVLSGDINMDDKDDGVDLVFPANTTRTDNAVHVLSINMEPTQASGNNNTYPTVVNGFSIGNGQAAGSDVSGRGGGIYIYGDNKNGGIFRIERCFLVNNYAGQGGAIYVDEAVKNVNNGNSLINQCVVYNNGSGERAAVENQAGGIYLAGEATVVNTSIFNNENGGVRLSANSKVLNSTVARNTGAGIDLIGNGPEFSVFNTIIWGNTTLSAENKPGFKNSAFHEVVVTDTDENTDNNGNIYVAKENRGDMTSPMFDAPSLKTSFDRDFNWRQTAYPIWSWNVLEGSVMLDKGDNSFYQETIYGNEDMAGRNRFDGTIDIGAYEYQNLPASRIRYVMPTAQGTGDGLSWANASGDLQKMIDELASGDVQAGEVWVAEGTYVPKSQLISGTGYSASFRMRDGISVYGGFAGTETTKQERVKKVGGMPWDYENETVLSAAYYEDDNLKWINNKWTLTSDSRHVVWFAPMSGEGDFSLVTTLGGVTIKGGYAQGGTGLDDFKTDRGAGVYMDGANVYMSGCIVKECYATGNGGGVYLRNGRIQNSLIFNNNADANGGAVYVDNWGLVQGSMLSNNSAHNGAGVYLYNEVAPEGSGLEDHPDYLILSTCVVSNNTMTGNGAVYCDKGGVLLQNTITNNNCITATDATDPNASQTGGIYINEYALVINSVIWNNQMGRSSSGINIPMYAKNPSASTVRFLNNAISGVNNAVWNNTLQQMTLSLVDQNAGNKDDVNSIGPRFVEPSSMGISGFNLESNYGVQTGWRNIAYYWKPVDGSNLWAQGMELGQMPDEVVLAPEVDIEGNVFAQKPATGAFNVIPSRIEYDSTTDPDALIVYVDIKCTEPDHTGNTWATAYRSLNDAISYLAQLDKSVVGNRRLQVHVLEGDIWPRYAYTNLDPKTATINVPVTVSGAPIEIYGGYHRTTDNNTVERNPLVYRSVINGNHNGKQIEDGLYHCITVESDAKLILDGFHVVNGYAAGTASRQYGAGLLAHINSDVTISNCIFENNTGQDGAAVDARQAKLTMQNCVVNNNTNTDNTKAVVNAQTLSMEHVTIVNNIGAAPANTNGLYASSFSAGNTSGNTLSISSVNAEGARNFANPTNSVGATLGFDTYLGGYSVFRPLTSSAEAGNLIINKSTSETFEDSKYDITTVNGRDLGGIPDLGAYEADLPEKETVIYVTENGSGEMNGTSWENAIAGNKVYDVIAGEKTSINTDNAQYAGFYNSSTCPYGEKSGASKLFFDYLDEGDLNQANVSFRYSYWGNISGITGIDIKNKREEQYVSGLQYAVEIAAKKAEAQGKDFQVWVAGGTYTDWKGFVIRDKVNVMGGFPNEGTPGESDRHPLLSSYISVNEQGKDLDISKYETIIQTREDAPYVKNSNNVYSGNNLLSHVRKPVLFQPDVCLPTMSPSGRESYSHVGSNYSTNYITLGGDGPSNTYRYQSDSEGNGIYVEYEGAIWDGFTIRHGYYTDYSANRDGGAGVRMFRGVTLQNCVVADNFINGYDGYQSAGMGAGIYCDGDNSQIVNCFVLNNVNLNPNSSGGGANLMVGTSYNCVFANNYSQKDGGGVFLENAYFYNNTVAFNTIGTGNGGGIRQWTRERTGGLTQEMKLYNTILYGNNKDAIFSEKFTSGSNCYIQTEDRLSNKLDTKIENSLIDISLESPFVSANPSDDNNYRLKSDNWCVNNGLDFTDVVMPETDADFTNRIKDCAIDVGAFELDNKENIKYTEVNKIGTYYVSQNGAGFRSGANPGNAACAMKLQDILTDAGNKVKNGTLLSAIVKVAGYEDASFVYNANTLASNTDPQSYTYVVPEGVTLMGGYFAGTYDDEGHYNGDGWDNGTGDYVRNPMKFRTVLSAVAEATQGSTVAQDVIGYHTVTFGAWPGTASLVVPAYVDGIWLEDGQATSMAGIGNPNTRGGGAIVPSGAHVRNCMVMNCSALQGGGLYVMPGGIVSGTAVLNNSAEEGGGIYADNTGLNESVTGNNRAHILSCTIANNEASSVGGGLYMEEGAVMTVNSIIFDNRASSDKNVSGVSNKLFEDSKLSDVYAIADKTTFYPFNSCFVETQEMPSDFENTMLESNKSLYFTDNYYRLQDYSLLIKHGLINKYQSALVSTFDVESVDMQNIERIQANYSAERLDGGAFAYLGGILPTDLFTRIFVSPTTNVTLPEGEDMSKYLGRSFYTSFSTLEDALGYIRSMRANGNNAATKFEIFVAGGTYKPTYERTTTADVDHDQRLYSFVVPQGVSIYGGFDGTEKYSSSSTNNPEGFTEIGGGVITGLEVDGPLETILDNRPYSDFNQNNIYEPWELANQTILSGQINASAMAKNAYHVLFTTKSDNEQTVNPVTLDGLTVMYGETDNVLSTTVEEDEQGRGGGIYSNGVTYLISGCRLLNNIAVRGGAVFVRDADLNLSGSILAGNKTVANTSTSNTLTSRGGAAYVSGVSTAVNLRAVNTLWANNESAGEGGAIGTNYAEGISSTHDPFINIMNNTFVRNKAEKNPVIYAHNGKSHIKNTLIWGNDGDSYDDATDLASIYDVSYSASDVDYVNKFSLTNQNHNILLDKDNMGNNGPRFTNPSKVAGVSGNSTSSLWNPIAISVLTDAGDGTEHTQFKPDSESETEHQPGMETGAYQQWLSDNKVFGIDGIYLGNENGSYLRYSGPKNQDNEDLCKSIDIGLYEYQYISSFSTMPEIYVDTISRGLATGNSWANATDDLRGAIMGASNPTDNYDKPRVVYVRDGEYSWRRISAGAAYILDMATSVNNISLTLKGSCTGNGDQQDFSNPTILRNVSDVETGKLMAVSANNKPVTIEGFTLINKSENGIALDASTNSGGSLTLKNCGFRISPVGMNISGSQGEMLIYNTLFADCKNGLVGADNNVTVVNATFANNTLADMSGATTNKIFNSVSWNNGTNSMPGNDSGTEQPTYYNKVFSFSAGEAEANNADIENGPNFVDPLNSNLEMRDYHIRPSLTLLNKGYNKNYSLYVLKSSDGIIPDTEKELGNNTRLVDNVIDLGAYEYEAELQPIVYVKADLTGTADGKTWETALGDLQGAVDLAGIYAYNHKDENGYVFVHGNYKDKGALNLTLERTNVYGGMYDERSSYSLSDNYTAGDVRQLVGDLLGKRKGMLEADAANRSSLENVTIGADGVIDGFEITGTTIVNKGILSTSVVRNDVSGSSEGMLYNSLVLGDGTANHLGNVKGVKAVNVTACGDVIDNNTGNNRISARGDNVYVTDDYWNYQLMETSGDIDAGKIDITPYITKVGHSRDLIGNKRIRNTVDNGCFETWNITSDTKITADDRPIGKSVVYVRAGKELQIDADTYPDGSAFNPGYLLLEHEAGLRGNNNFISLTNFAVERNVPAGGYDLAYMPFNITQVSQNVQNNPVTYQTYDGSIRAAYNYKYASADSKAWVVKDPLYSTNMAFLLSNGGTDDVKVRFSGNRYIENQSEKFVRLMKYNFNEPWASANDGGNRFTHKENMSWNLFGSPYLCKMNYGDMQYGRVIYEYGAINGEQGTKGYMSRNTADENVTGAVPSGAAVFTQTATLKDLETFMVNKPTIDAGNEEAGVNGLMVYLAPEEQTATDYIQLKAVPTEEASTDYDLASDGVKWMNPDTLVAQIYMTRNGGRYSLLSALDIEGSIDVGLQVPAVGRYRIGIDDEAWDDEYETVVLKDNETGRVVDLLEGAYTFQTTRSGSVEGRFSIAFNRMAAEKADSGIKLQALGGGKVRITGLAAGDRITAYNAAGVMSYTGVADNETVVINVQRGVCLIRINQTDGLETVRKTVVR